MMSGRTGRVRHLLGSLESVIGTLDQQKTQIIAAMESMNDLASTLNAERETIGDALDVMGPAVAVLADQHDELMQMLGALRPARQGRRPGDRGEQGEPDHDPRPSATRCSPSSTRPARAWRPAWT